jgi:hypothetical protein
LGKVLAPVSCPSQHRSSPHIQRSQHSNATGEPPLLHLSRANAAEELQSILKVDSGDTFSLAKIRHSDTH